MPIKYLCDCGCGKPIADFDAAAVPSIFQSSTGLIIEVRVIRSVGPAPMISPSCIPEIVSRSERIFPQLPKVVDAEVDAPIPLRSPKAATMGAPR